MPRALTGTGGCGVVWDDCLGLASTFACRLGGCLCWCGRGSRGTPSGRSLALRASTPWGQGDLRYGRIDEILAAGGHACLSQFLDRVGDLGVSISRDFLLPMAAW